MHKFIIARNLIYVKIFREISTVFFEVIKWEEFTNGEQCSVMKLWGITSDFDADVDLCH